MKVWWTANAAWLAIFVIGVIFICLRKVDGAGTVQTPEALLVSLVVLGTALIFHRGGHVPYNGLIITFDFFDTV